MNRQFQRQPFENRYCNGCQCTTRHEAKETTFSCLRCGVVKYIVNAVVKPASVTFKKTPEILG